MSRWKIAVLATVALLLVAVAVVWSQGGTPQFYSAAVEVRASPEQVFLWLTAPERQKQWVSGLVEVRPQNPGASNPAGEPPPAGTKWVLVVEKQGNRVEIDTEVTRIEKNQLVQTRMHAPFFDAVSHYDLSPTGQGTRVTQNLTITYSGLVRFLVPFTAGHLRQELQADLLHLRETTEAH